MTYKLTADLDDMSMNEARAVLSAIIEKFGTSIVDSEIKRRRGKKEGDFELPPMKAGSPSPFKTLAP